MRDVGKNIKDLRQQKNMTQDELAEKLFVTRQTVSNYETGKSRPDIEMLTRIAETLETDPNTVLYGLPQQVSREQKILKLCISTAVLAVVWIAFACLTKYAREIYNSTLDSRLRLICRLWAGPTIAFVFGWTAMQALSVFARLTPLKNPWSKHLRWAVVGLLAAYVLFFISYFSSTFNALMPDTLRSILFYAFIWINGQLNPTFVAPSVVLFGILGCMLWLSIPQKPKEI